MTTGQTFGDLRGRGARDWADFMEPHYHPLYKTIHDQLGVGSGTRLLDVGAAGAARPFSLPGAVHG